MGQHTFEWPYPAHEVYVTGTFDDWKRTVRLQKDDKSGAFVATINLNLQESDKILYKFVVDGNWTVLNAARKELDNAGFENNVLLKDDMSELNEKPDVESNAPTNTGPTVATELVINTVTPESTTTGLAANEPLAPQQPSETPTPALDDVPGGFPETPSSVLTANSVEEPVFLVNPMPASITLGNPIDLQPGQPIPDLFTQTVTDTVHLDKESYEKADASNLGVGKFLPPVITPDEERAAKGTGILDIPEITSSVIPENKEVAEVPHVVKESQEKAHVEPEASAVPEVVEAKKEVENEIEKVIPEAPAVSDGYLGAATYYHVKAEDVAAMPTATSSEQVTTAATIVSKVADNATNKPTESHVPQTHIEHPAENIPQVVKESIEQAHASPEAAGEPFVVVLKEVVEEELRREVPQTKAIEKTEPKDSVPVVLKNFKLEFDENANVTGSENPKSSPLSAPRIAPTTQTFTHPVSGTTNNRHTSKGESTCGEKLTEKDTNGSTPVSPSNSHGASSKKKRKSIISKLKNIFK
jgi:hypothetical protein